jgi:hypothetical protein
MNEVDPSKFLIYIKKQYTIKTNRVRVGFVSTIDKNSTLTPNIYKIKHKKNEKTSMLIGLLSVLAIVSCKEKKKLQKLRLTKLLKSLKKLLRQKKT